jgi:hypothetical protein
MNEMCFLFVYFYHRSQNDTLKKEILDQERGLKCQIATLEKKAHENWVSYSVPPPPPGDGGVIVGGSV